MELEGMIIRDLGLVEGTSKAGNPWKKHEYVLETLGQYPRKVKFDVFGDKCSTLTFELGKTYVIQVDAESREFNDRWYTDIRAFNARLSETASSPGPQFNPTQQAPLNPYNNSAASNFAQPAVESGNPFGAGSTDFSQSDSQEDLPF